MRLLSKIFKDGAPARTCQEVPAGCDVTNVRIREFDYTFSEFFSDVGTEVIIRDYTSLAAQSSCASPSLTTGKLR